MNKYNNRKTENKTSAYQTSRERGWGGTKWEKIGVKRHKLLGIK